VDAVVKKPAIMIAVESPFGEYDEERYRLSDLAQLTQLHILDLTPLVKPEYWRQFGGRAIQHDSIRRVSSDSELRSILESSSWDAWIDELGSERTARRIRRILLERRVLRVWLRLGLLPGDYVPINLRQRLIARKSQIGWLRTLRGLSLALPRKLLRFSPQPDVVLGSGSFTIREAKSGGPIIWSHSFDFEKASRTPRAQQQSAQRRIVFLDQALGKHPDLLHSRLRAPVQRDPYLLAMRRLFSRLEAALDGRVDIALHPKSIDGSSAGAFGDRFSTGQGAHTMVSGADLVLCHASASVSFAVIWRRPVLFVTSTELKDSWYHTHITQMASELERPIINVDELDAIPGQQISNLAQLDVNDEAYARYEEHYIRSRWSPPLPLWECFVLGMNEVLSRTVAP